MEKDKRVIIANKGCLKEVIDLEPDCGILLDDLKPDSIIHAIKLAQEQKMPEKAMKRLQEKLRWDNFEH